MATFHYTYIPCRLEHSTAIKTEWFMVKIKATSSIFLSLISSKVAHLDLFSRKSIDFFLDKILNGTNQRK